MNYELAKQLKEAGFPQKELHPEYRGMVFEGLKFNGVYIPSLLELIEACGDKFSALERYDIDKDPKRWIVFGNTDYHDSDEGMLISAEGATPKEAVAKLWLELNKK